jgi:hypothetical protein
MKNSILTLTIGLITFTLFGQSCSGIKGYAFERTVLPGAAHHTAVSEGGSTASATPRSMKSYLIYLEHKPDLNIIPGILWVAGKPFSVKGEYLKGAPSLVTDDPNDKILWDSVATKTSKKILSIQAIDSISMEPSEDVKKKLTDKNFVLEYTINKKNKLIVIDSAKKLKKEAMY